MKESQDYFEVLVGPYCKKDCLFCSEGGFGGRKIVSFEHYKKIILKNDFKKVVLSGGEPLLNKDLLSYISFAQNYGLSVSLVTAWSDGFGEEFIQSLIQSGLDELMISLEGPEKIHDFLVKSKGAYKNIIQALVLLQSQNIGAMKVILHTNLNKLNYKYIPAFIYKMLGMFPCISLYHLQMLEPIGSAFENRGVLFEKYQILLKPLIKRLSISGNTEKISFGRLPFCCLPSDLYHLIGVTPAIVNVDNGILEQEKVYIDNRHSSEECDTCQKRVGCDGFFKWYINKFGDEEITTLN